MLSYLWSGQTFDTLFMTFVGGIVALAMNSVGLL